MSTSKISSLLKTSYKNIVEEIKPLIDRYLRHDDPNVSLFGIKLIEREELSASFLVIASNKMLWSFKYEFVHPENWDVHPLQSSAKVVEHDELHSIRQNFTGLQGMTEQEADDASMKFFLDSPTCLQREELKAKIAS
ncbi:MAG: hypothetical protein HFJ55_04910 [Clostridia bacterium]|nr:hypothetical protein [Clostridia bacterium]